MLRRFFLFCFPLLAALDAQAQTADDLFNQDILHEVRLDIRPNEWAFIKEHFQEDIYVPCNFRWIFNGRPIDVPQIGCRNRGTGSRTPIKPGLRIQIDKYDKDRSFLGLKTIILRNNSQDGSMMHERVAMAFMRRMGLPAPRSTHTRLFVNGQYAGVYTIVEEIDEVFTARHFGNSEGYLYKYDYGKDDPAHIFEYLGPDPSKYSPKPFRPESHEDNPRADVIEAMIRTINQASDAGFEQAVSEYVDLRAFLLEVGVEAFLAEQDGILGDYGLNNFYVYRLPTSNRFNFIPWDKSNAFFKLDRPAFSNTVVNILMRRTLAIPAMRAAFVNVLLQSIASAGGPGGWLEQEIAREYAQIRAAALEDPNKLCDPGASGTLRPCSNAEFEAHVAAMLQFARERGNIIMRELSQMLSALPAAQPFSVSDRGALSFTTMGGAGSPNVGYARIQPTSGSVAPAGMAIFGYRSGGILVSETAVSATTPIQSGRIYAQVTGSVNTGLAIVNPGTSPAVINFYFTDSTGRNFGEGTFSVEAGRQIASFLNEPPFNAPASVSGTLTFNSSVPVAVAALRGFTNERSEFLVATLPIANLANPDAATAVPHFADGAGWSTQIVLVNPFDDVLAGRILVARDSEGLTSTAESLTYSLPPRGVTILTPTPSASSAGWIQVVNSDRPPALFALISYKENGITVTSTSIPAVPVSGSPRTGSAFRMYVESGRSLQSGVAISNASSSTVSISFEAMMLNGQSTGLTGTMRIPSYGHVALFLDQIPGLQSLPSPFRGVLRVFSAAGGIAVTGLRGRYNERGEFLVAGTPAMYEAGVPPRGEVIIPELVDSGGYTTQFVLYGAYAGMNASGIVQFFTQTGGALGLRYEP
jgi:spore coat protein CotH